MDNVFWLTTYVLMWPVIVAGTLTFIVRAFIKDARRANREGKDLI